MWRIYIYLMIILLFSFPTQADGNLLYELGVVDEGNPFVQIPLSIVDEVSNVAVDMRATSGDLDTLVFLIDDTGNILAKNSDRSDGIASETDSAMTINALPIGDYHIIASREGVEKGTSTGSFEVIVIIEPTANNELDYDISAETLTALGYPQLSPHPTADWTLMAFYGADTNLEAALLNDINEFELAGGSDESVRVIALVDRHPEHDASNNDWTTTRIFEINANTTEDSPDTYPPTIDSVELADLGELDTGDGETLAQFLAWAIMAYPAEQYAISIGSHGAGWKGLSQDESAGEELGTHATIISLPELTHAFAITKAVAGVDKFDLMINDACLMSSVEYHTIISDYFNLTLASPEITVNPALDMTLFTEILKSDADTDLTELGSQLVDKYVQEDMFTRGTTSTEYYAFSLVNLQDYDVVTKAINDFAELVNRTPELYVNLLGEARANVYTYSSFMGSNTLIDIGHLMEQVIILAHDVKIIDAAQNILQAVDSTRIYGNSGERAQRLTSYFNVYFPENSDDFESSYLSQSPLPEWGNMLRSFYNLQTPRLWLGEESLLTYHPPTAPIVNISQVFPITSTVTLPPTIKMEIEGRRIARGSFTVDQIQDKGVGIRFLSTPILTEIVAGDTANFVNQWRSGVDRSQFSWLPMTLPVVTDGETSENELLIKSESTAILEGRYKERGGKGWNDVAVFFSIATGKVERVISRMKGSGALAEVQIAPGSAFQSYRQYVKPDGRTALKPGTGYVWGEEGLSWSEEIAPSGQYNLGFLVQAFGGISGFDSVTINVDNDDIVEGRRGFVAINLGLTFSYPEDWITPFDTGSQIVTNNPAQTQSIGIHYFNAQSENIFQIAENYEREFGLESINDPTEIELGRQKIPTAEFDYTFDLNGVTWYGKGFAMFRETDRRSSKTSIIYALEAQSQEELDALVSTYRPTLRFFDPVRLVEQQENRWEYHLFKLGVLYPVPKGWILEGDLASGSSRIISNPDDPQINVQVTFYEETEDVSAIMETLRGTLLPDEFEIVEYETMRRVWQIVPFEFERDGAEFVSRVYFTAIDGEVYMLKFEAPNDEDVVGVFRNRFELMVDGFAPASNLRYALGDSNPTLLKANMNRALEVCDVDLDNVACYGQGELSVTVSDGVDTDSFDEAGETIDIEEIEELFVGFSEDDDTTFDSFSIAIIEPEVTQSNGETANITLGVFGGVSVSGDYVEIEQVSTGDE